jgi:hypothetical protein
VALGVALRLWEYLANFSLDYDSVCLALNVINRGARGLTQTLDFDQAAPLGLVLVRELPPLPFPLHRPLLGAHFRVFRSVHQTGASPEKEVGA